MMSKQKLYSAVAVCLAAGSATAADGFFGNFTNPAPGPSRTWQRSYQVSPYSAFNLLNGNTFTAIPLFQLDPVGPAISFVLYHNSSDATDDRSGEAGQGFDLGRGWSTSFSSHVTLNGPQTRAIVHEDDGRRNWFTEDGDYWAPSAGVHDRLKELGGGGWELLRPSQMKRVFDGDGLLSEVHDSSGNMVEIIRDPNSSDRITRICSAAHGLPNSPDPNTLNHQVVLNYDDPNHPERLTSVVDVIDREWHFSYDANGRLKEIHFPSGTLNDSKMNFAYDGSARITHIHARREESQPNVFWVYSYSGELLVEVSDPLENTGDPNDIPSQGFDSSVAFDELTEETFNIREVTDRRGNEWAFWFNDRRLVFIDDPLTNTQRLEYDSENNITSLTDELTNEWTATYGPVGNIETIDGPLNGQTWTFTWEQIGDPNSNFVRMTKVEDPNGRWTEFEYGDITDPNDPNDVTLIGRIIEEPATGGGSTATTKLRYYWEPGTAKHGQLKQLVDENGVVTQYTYDKWGYFAELSEGLTENDPASLFPVVLNQRNAANGWFIGGVDQEGIDGICCVSDDIVYDENGRAMTSCACQCSELSTEDYERLGDLPSTVFSRGKQELVTGTDYDVLGNPLAYWRDLPGLITGGGFGDKRKHEFSYDDLRRLTEYEVESGDGEIAFSREFTVNEYDVDGRVLEITGPDGITTVYTHDELGRVDTVARGTMSVDVDYYADSKLKDVEYGNGASIEYSYDAARRLTGIEHRDDTDTLIYGLSYERSLAGLTRMRTETTPAGTWEIAFEYDRRNRLVRETRTKTSVDPDVVEYDIEYEYDQLGNRLERTDNVSEQWTVYSYDVDGDPNSLAYPTRHNRLLWYELYDTSGMTNQLLRRVNYTYYDNGQVSNITLKDENADPNGDPNAVYWHYDLALHYFTHGPLRLAVWGRWQEDGSGPMPSTYEVLEAREFHYDDPRARYLAVDIATPSSTPGTWSVDGDVRWTDYEGVKQYADCEVDASTGSLVSQEKRYLASAAEQLVDPNGDPNDPNATVGTAYWHGDAIGSIVQTTDEAGAAESEASYTAFGDLVGSQGQLPRYRYAGGYGYEDGLLSLSGPDPLLPDVTLLHVGWRWYQPDIGRFIQRDLMSVRGGINVFHYAHNRPTRFVDPTGLTTLGDDIDDFIREYKNSPAQRVGQLAQKFLDVAPSGVEVGGSLGPGSAGVGWRDGEGYYCYVGLSRLWGRGLKGGFNGGFEIGGDGAGASAGGSVSGGPVNGGGSIDDDGGGSVGGGVSIPVCGGAGSIDIGFSW